MKGPGAPRGTGGGACYAVRTRQQVQPAVRAPPPSQRAGPLHAPQAGGGVGESSGPAWFSSPGGTGASERVRPPSEVEPL